MKSNEINSTSGDGSIEDQLKSIGNRIKSLRIRSGNLSYEKFAHENNIGRMLLRRCETGKNVNMSSFLKIVTALDVTVEEFFQFPLDHKNHSGHH
ncbi:helix-turn-helix domain-containing protein [Mucilaginibacter ginkgonis]|uniref:Helix-turn-helix transcriptional regulator n=1 Tax=Mucilaginibacter ginkgonis TaxID=2682091 RepID=A0A7T7FBE2_9SPHI|nr:helix-turn-helix transcriptional regulator [Mucilaginibacter ginkgonis]QQL50008.1 helix-turn-helix transcriptional regulator [Mucilaginibacter ginkgonis]